MPSAKTEETLAMIDRYHAAERQALREIAALPAYLGRLTRGELETTLRRRAALHRDAAVGAFAHVKAAEQLDRAGPLCTVDAHVGGITLNFQKLKLTCTSYDIEPRGTH